MDRERILSRLAQLDQYLRELRQIAPPSFAEYRNLEKRRACERLAQITIEAALDVCALIVRELRLGLPGEEDDVLTKLRDAGHLSGRTVDALRRMKGFRNILAHEHGVVEDRIVYEVITHQLGDLDRFADEARAVFGRGKEA